jgi:hypothetical protein
MFILVTSSSSINIMFKIHIYELIHLISTLSNRTLISSKFFSMVMLAFHHLINIPIACSWKLQLPLVVMLSLKLVVFQQFKLPLDWSNSMSFINAMKCVAMAHIWSHHWSMDLENLHFMLFIPWYTNCQFVHFYIVWTTNWTSSWLIF